MGSGNLRAFTAPWVPRAGAFKLTSEKPDDNFPWRVTDIVAEGGWNHDVVEALINPYAKAILGILISNDTMADRLV